MRAVVKNFFGRNARLHYSRDFQHVLKRGSTFKEACCKAYTTRNHYTYGRLGVIAAKRVVPLSTQRHRWKRIVKESFRLHQELLKGCDVILMVRYVPQHKQQLWASLQVIWHKINHWRKADP